MFLFEPNLSLRLVFNYGSLVWAPHTLTENAQKRYDRRDISMKYLEYEITIEITHVIGP